MKTIAVPISQGRTDLCRWIKKVESGDRIVFTAHGKPKAVLSAYRDQGPPWRIARPDDPKRYGDLQSPVMEEWR